MPEAVMEFKYVGKDQVTAEMAKVKKGMKALDRQYESLNDEGAKATRVFDKQRAAMRKFTTRASEAVKSIGQVAIGLAAIGMAANRFKDFVVEGEKANNVAVRFGQAYGSNMVAALGEAQRATADLVDDTSLQVMMNRFKRLGVPLKETIQLLEYSTKVAMDQGRGVMEVAKILETAVRGETTALMEIGVNLDETGRLVKAYGAETGRTTAEIDKMEVRLKVALPAALRELGRQFDDVDLSNFQMQAQQATTELENLMSDLSVWASTNLMLTINALTPTADSVEELTHKIVKTTSAIEALQLTGGIETAMGTQFITYQIEKVRELGQALGLMPAKLRLEMWDQLKGRLENIPPHLHAMVLELGGIASAIAEVSKEVAAVPTPSFRMTDSTADWWSSAVDQLEKGTMKFAKRKRRGGGGGGRKAAEEAMRKEIEGGLRLLEIQQEEGARAKVVAEFKRKNLDLEAKYAAILKSKLPQEAALAALEARRLELQDKELAALAKIDAVEDAREDARRERAAARAADAHAANLERSRLIDLGRIDLALSGEKDAKVIIALEFERKRLEIAHDLLEATDSEAEALVRQTEAQIAMTQAMADYNREIERLEGQQLADQLRDASSALSRTTSQMAVSSKELAGLTQGTAMAADAWAGYADGTTDVGYALAGTASAVGVAAQSFMEDERAKAGIAAAMEAAHAVAAYASLNIPAGIAHTVAAGMFTAIAAGAGSVPSSGGGGGAGGGGGGGAAAEREPQGGFGDQGGRQVIVQFGSGVILGNPQAVAKAVQQSAHSARGTGATPGW